MKTERLPLYNWHSNSDYIEIDWPKVHAKMGTDFVEWVLGQTEINCQFVVDKARERHTLVLEIYNDKTLALYRLMWAK